jgi:cation/acetate symporter
MLAGLIFTGGFILLNRSVQIFGTALPLAGPFLGITAQGIGALGMILNFVVTIAVSLASPPPPDHVRELVDAIRRPA